MALAAGFGLNFEECDAEVFAAVEDILAQREREDTRASLDRQLRGGRP